MAVAEKPNKSKHQIFKHKIMRNSANLTVNQTTKTTLLIIAACFSLLSSSFGSHLTTIPTTSEEIGPFGTAINNELDNDLYGANNFKKPTFENISVWRLQLRVKTSGKKNANTDDEVLVKFTGNRNSEYFLDRAGDDRERNKVNTYDILDPNISHINDIKFMHLMIKGNDGWCVKSVELLINDVTTPVYTKKFKSCHWLDGNGKGGPSLYITGKQLRKSASWKYTSKNKNMWLPPFLIKRATMEAMVESYIGHMMNYDKEMRKFEFGKKHGRAYVEAKKVGPNKLHFDLDLKYKINNAPDPEIDVDFDLVVNCHNKQINMSAQSVKGQLNIPLATKLIRKFKSCFAKMDMGNINFAPTDVPFCPTIKVKPNGDLSMRP